MCGYNPAAVIGEFTKWLLSWVELVHLNSLAFTASRHRWSVLKGTDRAVASSFGFQWVVWSSLVCSWDDVGEFDDLGLVLTGDGCLFVFWWWICVGLTSRCFLWLVGDVLLLVWSWGWGGCVVRIEMVVLSYGVELVEKVVFKEFEVEGVEKMSFLKFVVSCRWYRFDEIENVEYRKVDFWVFGYRVLGIVCRFRLMFWEEVDDCLFDRRLWYQNWRYRVWSIVLRYRWWLELEWSSYVFWYRSLALGIWKYRGNE